MRDWGVRVAPSLVLKTDSSAAKGFACRRGLGRNRHVSIRYLWLQDAVAKSRLRIEKVSTHEQLADVPTKPNEPNLDEERVAEVQLDLRQRPLRDAEEDVACELEVGDVTSEKALSFAPSKFEEECRDIDVFRTLSFVRRRFSTC